MHRPARRLLVVFLLVVALALSLVSAACSDPLADARALEKKGDLEGAVAVYQKAIEDQPTDLPALVALSVDLLQLKRYDEALPLQEKIVALDPKDSLTRVELAFNYLNHQDQPAKAVRYLEEAAKLDPSAKNLTFLAQAQDKNGDAAGAEKSLRAAMSADSSYSYAYSLLIALLDKQGRADDAAAVRQAAAKAGLKLQGA